ncbi:MAG: GNAT family N-acetyltransferase, partial [Promethearchaeota archaeon]
MKTWDFEAKDGRIIRVRHAVPADARDLYHGFSTVIDEGIWLPTFNANSSVADWVNWIQRTTHSRDVMLVAELGDEYVGHLTLQTEEWMASQHVARLGIIVAKAYRGIGVGRALMQAAEDAGVDAEYEKIILSTFRDNEIAISMYHAMGYREVGVRARHFAMPQGYIDEVLFEKWIA